MLKKFQMDLKLGKKITVLKLYIEHALNLWRMLSICRFRHVFSREKIVIWTSSLWYKFWFLRVFDHMARMGRPTQLNIAINDPIKGYLCNADFQFIVNCPTGFQLEPPWEKSILPSDFHYDLFSWTSVCYSALRMSWESIIPFYFPECQANIKTHDLRFVIS